MRVSDDPLDEMARRFGRAAKKRKVLVALAESCTGGGLAACITRIPGSAHWFDRSYVTYSNDAKRQMLGVSKRTLERYGAVSEQVAREMVRGALRRSISDVAVSITGIAGPTGATPGKPVGLVWIAWASRGGDVQPRAFLFKGDRVAVRRQAIATALQGLIELVG